MAHEIIRSVLEFSAIILILAGLCYEKKIIEFENKVIRAICIRIVRAYNRSKEQQANEARKTQPRSPAIELEDEERPEFKVLSKSKKDYRVA